jgi:Carbohydrate esterase, sialic acid-specific acetylesterase
VDHLDDMIRTFFTVVCLAVPALLNAETNAVILNLTAPADYQVIQRQTKTTGTVIIAGTFLPETKETLPVDGLEARFSGLSDGWRPLPFDPHVASFRGAMTVPAGGWYRLEVRALQQGRSLTTNTVGHVGVGEIFVIGGQSNSANYGEEKNQTQTGLVVAFDGTKWQLAGDPEPGAGGKKGSFMPLFGDEMANRFHVPIGIVPVGIGSTSVREWLPAGTRFSRLTPLTRNIVTVGPGQWEASGKIFDDFTARIKLLGTNGFRAMLWHQGESDAKQADPQRTLPGEQYRQYLEQLIRDSRREIGWDAPWFVAQASYHNADDVGSPDIRDAQKKVWDDGLALPGPDTDTLTGDMREKNGTGIHLSAKGLKAHAHLWVEKVAPWLETQFEPIK